MRQSVVVDFWRRALGAADAPAVSWHEAGRPAATMSYGELLRAAEGAARGLRALGVRRGDRVADFVDEGASVARACCLIFPNGPAHKRPPPRPTRAQAPTAPADKRPSPQHRARLAGPRVRRHRARLQWWCTWTAGGRRGENARRQGTQAQPVAWVARQCGHCWLSPLGCTR
jgi:hypothetical protein